MPLLERVVRARPARSPPQLGHAERASRPAPTAIRACTSRSRLGRPDVVDEARRRRDRSRSKSRVVEDRQPDRRERRVREGAALLLELAQRDGRRRSARRDDRRAPTACARAAGRSRRCGTSAADSRSARRLVSCQRSAAATPVRTSASWVSTQPFGLRGRARTCTSSSPRRGAARGCRARCTSSGGHAVGACRDEGGAGRRIRRRARAERDQVPEAGGRSAPPRRGALRGRRARRSGRS